MLNKDRCKCGNLVPKKIEFKEFGGTCRACAREKKEATEKRIKEAERAERIAYYRSSLSYWN